MITTYNYTLEQGEKGIVVAFPTPTNIKPLDQYLIYFDAPILLPKNPPTSVTFEPQSGSYIISGVTPFASNTASITPKVFIKINSTQKIQTKTLIRLIIKDTKNNILYTDYALVICSPKSVTNLSGRLLLGVGPNGGAILSLDNSASNRSSIYVRSIVTGPGIPNDRVIKVINIIGDSQIELSEPIGWIQQPYGTYTFTISFDCIDSANLVENSASSTYMVLDINNNWTYKIRDHIIAKFIVEDPVENNDVIVLLPIKNTALLGSSNTPQPIPATCIIKGGGRVIRDTIPLSDF